MCKCNLTVTPVKTGCYIFLGIFVIPKAKTAIFKCYLHILCCFYLFDIYLFSNISRPSACFKWSAVPKILGNTTLDGSRGTLGLLGA